jgi:hypothetical protein
MHIKPKIMLIITSILLSIALVFVIAKLRLTNEFEEQVKSLFAQSKSLAHLKVDYKLLDSLPTPVHYH